jgi:hypothetical protein
MRSYGHSAVGLVAAFRVAKPPAGADLRPQFRIRSFSLPLGRERTKSFAIGHKGKRISL